MKPVHTRFPNFGFISFFHQFLWAVFFTFIRFIHNDKDNKSRNILYFCILWKRDFSKRLSAQFSFYFPIVSPLYYTKDDTASTYFLLLPIHCKTFLITPECFAELWWNFTWSAKFSLTDFKINLTAYLKIVNIGELTQSQPIFHQCSTSMPPGNIRK